MTAIFAVSLGEDGLDIREIADFPRWIRDRTFGVKADSQPVFLDQLPIEWSRGEYRPTVAGMNGCEYVLIRGEIIVPKPRTVVTEYELPK